jgi:hypothetical protein
MLTQSLVCFNCRKKKVILGIIGLILVACQSTSVSNMWLPSGVKSPAEHPLQKLPTANALWQAWLQPTDCILPCWEGIQLGEMKRSEVVQWLREKGYSVTTENGTITAESDYWANDRILTNAVWLRADTLTGTDPISSILTGASTIKLHEAVALLGEPSHVLGYYEDPPHGEPVYWALHVVWLEKGVELYRHGRYDAPDITEKLRLSTLQYFVPSMDVYRKGQPNSDYLREWQGYAEFEFYDATEAILNAPDPHE